MGNGRPFHFNYDISYATALREAVNDRQKFSYEKEYTESKYGKPVTYFAWDCICAIMDRLEDTLDYINGMELGNCRSHRAAFDFYEFINNAYIVIDCIKEMGRIFGIDNLLIEEIENSNEVFGKPIKGLSSDEQYFSYIRSVCAVHPIGTNNRKHHPCIEPGQLHCCPFVTWKSSIAFNVAGDLLACIYTSERNSKKIYLGLCVTQFEKYLRKWVDLIPKVIEAKNNYTDSKYEELRHQPVKQRSDFDSDVDFLYYLKEEYCRRFDDDREYIFDDFIRVFTISLSNPENEDKLEKYKNAIRYALQFHRNQLQNMSYDGFENTGIQEPYDYNGNDLFEMLGNLNVYDTSFSSHGYEISKLYYLEPNDHYSLYDKQYARELLEVAKEQINKYVVFTNQEPDEEVVVLVKLALYFDLLRQKTLLNMNIPNEDAYRLQVLSDQDCSELFIVEKNDFEDSKIELTKLLQEYGN